MTNSTDKPTATKVEVSRSFLEKHANLFPPQTRHAVIDIKAEGVVTVYTASFAAPGTLDTLMDDIATVIKGGDIQPVSAQPDSSDDEEDQRE